MPGTLFVVGTPIGNLEDLSPRARRVLASVKIVAAEDTRRARELFNHLGIAAPQLVSTFDGNEAARAEELAARVAAGDDVALISDAGMPGVSDPGQRVVAAAVAAGAKIEVIPGPAAFVVALVASGLPTDRFTFLGFPPREQGARRELFGSLRIERATLCFYEAPTRAADTVRDLADAFGVERAACLSRELTKMYEEHIRLPLGALAERLAATPPRGECTLVVAGASEEEARAAGAIDVESEVRAMLATGLGPKEVAARLAVKTGLARRQLYQLALTLRDRG